MTSDEADANVVCPTADEILNYKLTATSQCQVCKKHIKNQSAMRMHLAQTHGIGAENVLQSFNKAFNGSSKLQKSLYACPVFTCSRTYGTGRYFKALTTLREHYLCIHAEKKYVCQKCGAKFGNPKRIELHMKSCKTMYYCTCGSPFKRKDALLEHSVKNQHELPLEIKNELLGKGNDSGKEKSTPSQPNIVGADIPPIKNLIFLPQTTSMGQPMKTNAFLIISNSMLGKNAVQPSYHVPNPNGFYKTSTKSISEISKELNSVKTKSGTQIISKDVIASNRNEMLVTTSAANTTKIVNTESPIQTSPNLGTALVCENVNGLPSLACGATSLDSSNVIANAEKLKRLNKALQQFKPIKKKNPLDPVVSEWQCIIPPRKYRKRRKKSDDKKIERVSNLPHDESSVTSMQHCLKKASNLVKSLLPSMRSPRRGSSPDLGLGDSLSNGLQRCRESKRETQKIEKEIESPFERISFSFADTHKSEQSSEGKEIVNQSSLISLKDFIISSASSTEFKQPNTFSINSHASDAQGTACTEFNVENLTPELLGFLRTSVDLNSQHKSIHTPATSEMSTQETQTPVKVGNNQFSFDSGYPFLCHFDNNDIETQTENFTSFLADAFTQTNQRILDKNNANPRKPDDCGNFEESSPHWMHNNQTQTDNINEFITDAFTQTRIGVDDNVTGKARASSIADIHTQTNLSFDNFMKNFNFGTEDDTLDSNIMPDFTDMCTQTNPDPRFDPRFDELLAPLSSPHPQVNTPNSSLNLPIHNSHTQTVLSFDDMFANSMGDDEVNIQDCKENSTTFTQTSIIDDIFQNDNFTQTQFSV